MGINGIKPRQCRCTRLAPACNSLRRAASGEERECVNLSDLLRVQARDRPGKTAVIFGAIHPVGEISYGDLDAQADGVAATLAEHGVGRGDRVVLAMPNLPHFAAAYFGSLRAGAAVVPLNVMLTEREVAAILADSEAAAVIGAPPFLEVVVRAATQGRGPVALLSTESWADIVAARADFETVDVSEDDIAVVAYTSGTTANPRGAMLTHRNLLSNLDQQLSTSEDAVTQEDVLLISIPLFHIFGLNVPLGLLVKTGATGVLLERFDPTATLAAIHEHRVTILFGAPPMFAAWLEAGASGEHDLSSVRLAVSGSAPLPPAVITQFEDLFGIQIYEGYGLTETAPTLTSNRMAAAPRPGSVGKPLPGVELRIIDEMGNDVELGDPGEIIVRGPNVFKGYWRKQDETARVLQNGWFRTGDIAIEDEDGFIHLVGRKRDLIIVSGFNVYPSEVEEALLEVPEVREAAVIGVSDERTGEAVKAYVVLREGAALNERELSARLETRLARFKCPREITFVDELAHVVTGKVLRRALRT
jgi:long-chain acyl-CoA synthetase